MLLAKNGPINEPIENIRLGSNVINSRRPITDLSSEKIIENRGNVLLALEVNSMYILDHDSNQIGVVDLLS